MIHLPPINTSVGALANQPKEGNEIYLPFITPESQRSEQTTTPLSEKRTEAISFQSGEMRNGLESLKEDLQKIQDCKSIPIIDMLQFRGVTDSQLKSMTDQMTKQLEELKTSKESLKDLIVELEEGVEELQIDNIWGASDTEEFINETTRCLYQEELGFLMPKEFLTRIEIGEKEIFLAQLNRELDDRSYNKRISDIKEMASGMVQQIDQYIGLKSDEITKMREEIKVFLEQSLEKIETVSTLYKYSREPLPIDSKILKDITLKLENLSFLIDSIEEVEKIDQLIQSISSSSKGTAETFTPIRPDTLRPSKQSPRKFQIG